MKESIARLIPENMEETAISVKFSQVIDVSFKHVFRVTMSRRTSMCRALAGWFMIKALLIQIKPGDWHV